MTEDNDIPQEKKPLSLKTLSLKKGPESQEQIRQSFSHGRSKSVTVEVVKKKKGHHSDSEKTEEFLQNTNLNPQEIEARLKAIQSALNSEDDIKNKPVESDIIISQHSQKNVETIIDSPEETVSIDLEVSLDLENVLPKEKKPLSEPTSSYSKPDHKKQELDEDGEEIATKKLPLRHNEIKKTQFKQGEVNFKNIGKASMNSMISSDGEEAPGGQTRRRSQASVQRAREKHRNKFLKQFETAVKISREVILPEVISVQELANRMAERASDVVKSLMKMGLMATINQIIDADTAELVAAELGHTVKRVADSDVEIGLDNTAENPEDFAERAPVVTVMGHVDHGKTSLLDALRSTDVVATEAGGITQHIGAYQVTMSTGQKITFIDTPGHAAFSEMRARGAIVTDVVVLVVAADDGIKAQTIEAIRHAQAAKVPIVVAVNKMDKPGADFERVKQELLQYELVVEELGGDVLAVPVSAKKRMNLEKLEEAILLQSEVLDLKANIKRSAKGIIVEAKLEKGRGAIATVLIQGGTLKVGDIFVAGNEWGRVRALINDHGKKITEAYPSMPVEVLGFDGTPLAGDDFLVVENETKAREVSDFRKRRKKDALSAAKVEILRGMFANISENQKKELHVVIKSDVGGSLEAITSSLSKMTNDEVIIKVLHGAVGGITESDVTLAKASQALIIGFNVRANPQARDLAKRDGVDIRYYSIIYNVIDDVKNMLSGLLSPTYKENFLGTAEIRQIFSIPKIGKIGGSMVTSGTIKRGAKVRLLRDNIVIHEGSLKTLKRFKDEVKEVREGFECGIAFENYNDIREKDTLECFEIEAIQRTFESND